MVTGTEREGDRERKKERGRENGEREEEKREREELPNDLKEKVSDYIDSYYPKSHTYSVSRLSEIEGAQEEQGNRLPDITYIDMPLTKEVLNRFDEHHYSMVRQIDISTKQFEKIQQDEFYRFLKKLTNLECLTF